MADDIQHLEVPKAPGEFSVCLNCFARLVEVAWAVRVATGDGGYFGYVFCVRIEYIIDFPPLISGVGVERRAGRTEHLLGAGGFTWKPRNPRRLRLPSASAGGCLARRKRAKSSE